MKSLALQVQGRVAPPRVSRSQHGVPIGRVDVTPIGRLNFARRRSRTTRLLAQASQEEQGQQFAANNGVDQELPAVGATSSIAQQSLDPEHLSIDGRADAEDDVDLPASVVSGSPEEQAEQEVFKTDVGIVEPVSEDEAEASHVLGLPAVPVCHVNAKQLRVPPQPARSVHSHAPQAGAATPHSMCAAAAAYASAESDTQLSQQRAWPAVHAMCRPLCSQQQLAFSWEPRVAWQRLDHPYLMLQIDFLGESTIGNLHIVDSLKVCLMCGLVRYTYACVGPGLGCWSLEASTYHLLTHGSPPAYTHVPCVTMHVRAVVAPQGGGGGGGVMWSGVVWREWSGGGRGQAGMGAMTGAVANAEEG